MIVQLLTHTPKPHEIVAAAAKLCYSDSTIDEIMADTTSSKTALIKKVLSLSHFSVLEHISFSFGIEGISRACSHQLVRHRLASFSQQSQRYVAMQGNIAIGRPSCLTEHPELSERYDHTVDTIEKLYQDMLLAGIPAENARSILPNATETKLVVTMNARELRHFFSLRCCNRAQTEIREMAKKMLLLCRDAAPLLFADSGPSCLRGACPEGKMTCGKMIEVREEYQ